MFDEASAMCCTPGPWLNSRYSSLWLFRDGSRRGRARVALPQPGARAGGRLAQPARGGPPRVPLLEHVRRLRAHGGLATRIGGAGESQRVLAEVRRLLRVPDPELDMV